MNESRFAFTNRPFAAVPRIEQYVNVGNSEWISRQCIEAVSRNDGPVAIFGGAGMGKTMTCLRIAQAVAQSAEVIFLSSSQIASRADLLKTLLFELRMPYRGLFDGELRLSLIERLQHRRSPGAEHIALIVDEAQALSPRILEELRLLTNLTVDNAPCISLILCGSMRLEEMLCNPQLESLQQRICSRHFLRPLTIDECVEYVRHKVELGGIRLERVFDSSAVDAMFLVSGGVPRLIDQIADRAISSAGAAVNRPINASDIEQAWHAQQQAVPPWSDPGIATTSSKATVVESQAEDQIAAMVEDVSDISSEVASKNEIAQAQQQSTYASEYASTDQSSTQRDELAFLGFAEESQSQATPQNQSEPSLKMRTRVPPSAGMGLSSVIPRDTTEDNPSSPHAVVAALNEQINQEDDEFEQALEAFDLRVRAETLEKAKTVDVEALFGNDFTDETYLLKSAEEQICANCNGAGFCIDCDQMEIIAQPSLAEQELASQAFFTVGIEDSFVADDLYHNVAETTASGATSEDAYELPSLEQRLADSENVAATVSEVEYENESSVDYFSFDSESENVDREHAAKSATEAFRLDTDSVELNSAVVGYGYESQSRESFDLQPISAASEHPDGIENELLDMISNINLESISIDPSASFQTFDRREVSAEQARWEQNEQQPEQGGPTAFGNFVDVTGQTPSFFSDAFDSVVESATDEDIDVDADVDYIDNSIPLRERLQDLETLASVDRRSSNSLSMSDFDSDSTFANSDDREILIIDEDVASYIPETHTDSKPVAAAMLQSYSKLFSNLRT